MDYEAGELLIEGNNYYVQSKKRFIAYASALEDDKMKCFEFAYDMSYGNKGEHRDSRSGGTAHRTKGQIFINAFQGKLAEFALYRFLMSKHINVDIPDTSRYELGVWDSFDLNCQGKHISVKSTKSYGNLLLLEEKDWNEEGEYKPNISTGNSRYDYTILVRFEPDGEKIMRDNKLLFLKETSIPTNIKDLLFKLIYQRDWKYDFPGFIYYSELVKMINQKRIIPKDAMLNGGTKMDATNYYFQTGNMHSIIEVYTRHNFYDRDERAEVRLIRKCPLCGNDLVLRHGYNWFWGCKGYSDKIKCGFTEAVENA